VKSFSNKDRMATNRRFSVTRSLRPFGACIVRVCSAYLNSAIKLSIIDAIEHSHLDAIYLDAK
jgi:hypothetical protein